MLKKILLLSMLISFQVGCADKNDIIQALEPFFGKIKLSDIHKTPFPMVYEVILNDKLESVLISENGRYLIEGKVIDLATRKQMLSVTDNKRKKRKKALLDTIIDKDKIIFKAKNEKYAVNVFTDVDCPFCQKLHAEVPKMNKLGISIKYLASPLAGLHPEAQGRMEKIWCATNKAKAMDAYKKRKTVPHSKACDNPVAKQLAIAQQLGVTGTPAVFLPDGTHIPGYLSANALLKRLEATKQSKQ